MIFINNKIININFVLFNFSANYSNLPSSGVMINLVGVLYVIFGGLVFYLATNPAYKRKPLPEDTALLTNGAE